MRKKRNPYSHLVREQIGTAIRETSMRRFKKIFKMGIPYDPIVPLFGLYSVSICFLETEFLCGFGACL